MKIIPNFPNYAISKDGEVWSDKSYKFLSPGISNCGYLRVILFNNKKRFYRTVHRLVLETYVGPRPPRMQCRHLDGNRQNNQLDNLKWGTGKENQQDMIRHGTSRNGEKNGRSKLTEQNVRMIIYMRRTKEFTQQEIASIYNVARTTVVDIISKKNWKHIWKT